VFWLCCAGVVAAGRSHRPAQFLGSVRPALRQEGLELHSFKLASSFSLHLPWSAPFCSYPVVERPHRDAQALVVKLKNLVQFLRDLGDASNNRPSSDRHPAPQTAWKIRHHPALAAQAATLDKIRVYVTFDCPTASVPSAHWRDGGPALATVGPPCADAVDHRGAALKLSQPQSKGWGFFSSNRPTSVQVQYAAREDLGRVRHFTST
jgi:hypothetical protein